MKNVEEEDIIKSENEKEAHYEFVKNYFKKSAEENKKFYSLKNKDDVEKQIKKRRMWKIYTSILDKIIKKDSEISNVIDIACGIGNFTFEIAKNNNYKNIVGIDFLKETIDIARKNKNLFKNVTFLQGDLLNLPFIDKSFDFSVCLNTLHHIHKNDLYKAITEISRITKKYLMLEIRNKNYIFKSLHNIIILQRVYRDLPIYFSSVSDLNNLMGKNGFKPIIIRGNNLLIWTSWRIVIVYKRY
ncbi:MAG: hypothetical protein AYK22_01145 [Thermoplasmatales archaeon SG8-52-3]|nr:MAG: hypothetical protein AYK22_01145 [Thermoplasmatales archaeon SG8-52-3]